MRKKVEYQGHNRLPTEFLTDTIKYVINFSVVDSSLIGSPREKNASVYHKITVGITIEELVNWGWANARFELIVAEADLFKVLFWYAKELVEEKLKYDNLLQDEEFLVHDDKCPFELPLVPEPSNGFVFEVDIASQQELPNKFETLYQKKEHIKRCIYLNSRALQKLKEQESKFGPLYVPPYISIEIEEREAEDERLRAELAEIEDLSVGTRDDHTEKSSPSVFESDTQTPVQRPLPKIGEEKFQVLCLIYVKANGSPFSRVDSGAILTKLGLSQTKTLSIGEYLHRKGLIKFRNWSEGIWTTHLGIVKVESDITASKLRSPHVSPNEVSKIEERIRQRFLFLRHLDKKTNSNCFKKVLHVDMAKDLKLEKDQVVREIMPYLAQEGWIKIRTNDSISITEEGIERL